jgi:manganese-dependent ADP-ribose/CDP-alcohol diphosphatase
LDHYRDLKAVVAELGKHDTVVHHCIGNHELSSIPRDDLLRLLGLQPNSQSYYTICPAKGWRLVVLDTYDLAVKAWAETHPKFKETHELLERGKARAAGRGAAIDIDRCRPFMDHAEMNGGVGREQLEWLTAVVDRAHEAGERLIVATHAPLHPAVTMDGYAICWNFDEVMAVLNKHPLLTVLCLSGHDHEGAHRVDSVTGTHHVLVEAALEGPKNGLSHATVEVYEDKISIIGEGNVRSHEIDFQLYNSYVDLLPRREKF